MARAKGKVNVPLRNRARIIKDNFNALVGFR